MSTPIEYPMPEYVPVDLGSWSQRVHSAHDWHEIGDVPFWVAMTVLDALDELQGFATLDGIASMFASHAETPTDYPLSEILIGLDYLKQDGFILQIGAARYVPVLPAQVEEGESLMQSLHRDSTEVAERPAR